MAGGGFGEAALMSAVIGGGVSAAKGEDPLKGALLGGALGGIGNLLIPAAPAVAGGVLTPAVASSALAPAVAETAVLGSVANPFATQAVNQAAQTALTTASAPALAAEQLALGQAAIPSITANAQHAGLVNAASQIPKEAVTSPGGLGSLMDKIGNLSMQEKLLYGGTAALAAPTIMGMFKGKKELGDGIEEYSGPLKRFKYDPDRYVPLEVTRPTPYKPVYTDYQNYAGGGTIEEMSNANAVGANTGYPMADIAPGAYATPYQQPISRNVLFDASDTGVNPMTGEMSFAPGGFLGGVGPMGGGLNFRRKQVSGPQFAVPVARPPVARPTPYKARYAQGGISDLGGYSDYARGGRMLKGPGDGMSDNIPASIAGKQPARLANEEFVIPADVVSHLGNGSSEAGAKQLYKMMERVRKARTGNKKQGKQINPEKYLA